MLFYYLNSIFFNPELFFIKIYEILKIKFFDMFLLGFRRKMTALTYCKSIESAIQSFQIHIELPLQPYKIQLYTFRVQYLAFFLPWFPD